MQHFVKDTFPTKHYFLIQLTIGNIFGIPNKDHCCTSNAEGLNSLDCCPYGNPFIYNDNVKGKNVFLLFHHIRKSI